MAKDLKYDFLRGGKSSFVLPMAASQTIYRQSGKFVYMSGGYGTLATDASTFLTGWVETELWDFTAKAYNADYWKSSATAAAQKLNCIRDLTAVFRMPLAYLTVTYTTNYADTLIGYLRDIYTSTYQYCDMTNGTDDFLLVVGGSAASAAVAAGAIGDGYVDVMMNPATSIGV